MGKTQMKQDAFLGYEVALIGPPGALRNKLEHELRFVVLSGARIHRYHSANSCTWRELGCCAALYAILDSQEEIDAVHALRPVEEETWPLVVIITSEHFGIDAFALGACHCLMPPLEREAVREGFRQCLEQQETHAVKVTVLRQCKLSFFDRWIIRVQKRFRRPLKKTQPASGGGKALAGGEHIRYAATPPGQYNEIG